MSENRPALRIVRGDPSAQDIAVVTALLAAAGGGEEPAPSRVRRGGWNDPQHGFTAMPRSGPNAWRSSLR